MDSGKVAAAAMTVAVDEEEKERLIEVLDFDKLCSRVAMKTNQGKWNNKLHEDNNYYNNQECYDDDDDDDDEMEVLELGGGGGVFRMWEGDLVECFDDQRLLLQSSFCPWYRFGENMKLAGFGSCLLQGNNSSLDDCLSHLICPCCTLAQESRTLEMNNVHDGMWHGRGDTMCIGTYVEGVKAFELIPPVVASINSPQP
ncbi:uncharacterized protein [Rutidosis leptorrhynchoides]|uniref:uncharacterized protein n=1 Tax=Rutidosis leptorrhynchoides TaxID=125765 RepID=UPI003A990D96